MNRIQNSLHMIKRKNLLNSSCLRHYCREYIGNSIADQAALLKVDKVAQKFFRAVFQSDWSKCGRVDWFLQRWALCLLWAHKLGKLGLLSCW